LDRIDAIKYVKTNDAWLKVMLLTSGYIQFRWFESLEWRIRHLDSRRTARVGSHGRPVVRTVDRSDGKLTLMIAPIFPSLGELQMSELFRVDLFTSSGQRKHFFNTPYVPERFLLEQQRRDDEGPGKLLELVAPSASKKSPLE